MDNKKLSEDPSTKELNQFVQTMLKSMPALYLPSLYSKSVKIKFTTIKSFRIIKQLS